MKTKFSRVLISGDAFLWPLCRGRLLTWTDLPPTSHRSQCLTCAAYTTPVTGTAVGAHLLGLLLGGGRASFVETTGFLLVAHVSLPGRDCGYRIYF